MSKSKDNRYNFEIQRPQLYHSTSNRVFNRAESNKKWVNYKKDLIEDTSQRDLRSRTPDESIQNHLNQTMNDSVGKEKFQQRDEKLSEIIYNYEKSMSRSKSKMKSRVESPQLKRAKRRKIANNKENKPMVRKDSWIDDHWVYTSKIKSKNEKYNNFIRHSEGNAVLKKSNRNLHKGFKTPKPQKEMNKPRNNKRNKSQIKTKSMKINKGRTASNDKPTVDKFDINYNEEILVSAVTPKYDDLAEKLRNNGDNLTIQMRSPQLQLNGTNFDYSNDMYRADVINPISNKSCN